MGDRHKNFEDPITWTQVIRKTKSDLSGFFLNHPLVLNFGQAKQWSNLRRLSWYTNTATSDNTGCPRKMRQIKFWFYHI